MEDKELKDLMTWVKKAKGIDELTFPELIALMPEYEESKENRLKSV